MIPIESCYTIEINETLNINMIEEISQEGFSRIPIYEESRENIVGVIHVSDISFINPSDNIPIKNVLEACKRNLIQIPKKTKIMATLAEFKKGFSHLAIVCETKENRENKACAIGIVTLQGIIRTILQSELKEKVRPAPGPIYNWKDRKRSFSVTRVTNREKHPQVAEITTQLSLSLTKFLMTGILSFFIRIKIS
uniref:Metal transporter CNNM2 (Trinotate prediction) n=1 Tax=Myxobolus squamalis TaxID=59785 RepID=A0A6B2G563_MYXSQ